MREPFLPGVGISMLAAALLTACGDVPKLSGDSIEKRIVQRYDGNRGYAGIEVSCPDVDNEVGQKFTCEVTGTDKFTRIDGSVAAGDGVRLDQFS